MPWTSRHAILLLLAAGCAGRTPPPATATVPDKAGAAKAPAADPGRPEAGTCDLGARGARLVALDAASRAALVDGLVGGRVDPEAWLGCASLLLRSSPPTDAGALLDALGRADRDLLRRPEVEGSADLQRRISAMQRLYVDHGLAERSPARERLLDSLRAALADGRLGPGAARLGRELIDAVDLARGRWAGRPVDAAQLDALQASGDEATLLRLATGLPSAELRAEARRRVIRLRIAASPFPEVRAAAAYVEEVLVKQGNHALSPVANPPLRGWLEMARVPLRGVLVRQNLRRQTATLVGHGADPPSASVLPGLELRGTLMLEVTGISRPVTLCPAPPSLDPSPCIDARDVTLWTPLAQLDRGGELRFAERMTIGDAVTRASLPELRMAVGVREQQLLTLVLPLRWERPEDLVLEGTAPGTNGPDLVILADHRDPSRIVFSVSGAGASHLAVVEAADAPSFRIVSRGARGATGATGNRGLGGASGQDCQRGGDGGTGGTGGAGWQGGSGGNVLVDVTCGDRPCDETIAMLRRSIVSEAGPGGSGGAGGPGGPGGAGGPGRPQKTHVDGSGQAVIDDRGCPAGARGNDGASGARGQDGSPGRPGAVTVRLARGQ